MKIKTSTIILIIAVLIGLSLALYPSFSDYWNRKHTTHAITAFVQELENIDEEDYQEIWNEAIVYNSDLLKRSYPFSLTPELADRYWKCLDVTGTGIMGYIEIPKINVDLAVYHGTSDGVIQMAVGHLDWTSLPTGGAGTHCVLSSHRGLANARLFTDLDQLREGDTFTLSILNEVLTYEVDQIRIVLPTELSDLRIEADRDYCTLLTCTPYGINTHRMLVRGHRIETDYGEIRVVSEAVLIDQLIVASVLAVPILFFLLMAVMLKKPEKKYTLEQIISSK